MTSVRAVAVATATLWTGMQAPRLVDSRALGVPSRVRDWTRLMDSADRLDLHGRVESQALLGDVVVVDEERDGWARVVLPAQPSSKDPRGYPGWIPTAQLTDWGRPATTAAVVRAPTTVLSDSPDGTAVIIDVSFGTNLPTAGAIQDGWVPVHVPGRVDAAWLAESDVDNVYPARRAVEEFLKAALQFCDLPYMWGGTSGMGLDCSGLVHLVFRRFGVTVPRDAHDQAAAAPSQIEPNGAVAGDLLFFAKPGQDIHHVGIATGVGRMLHAPETGRGIAEEALPPHRLDTLVGAGRWV